MKHSISRSTSRRLFLVFVVAALCGPPLAHAFIPINIENAVRSWFNSAGKLVRFTFSKSTAPALSTSGNCILYMDATANALMSSCNGDPFSVVSGGALSCFEDASGNLDCNSFTSRDQGSITPTPKANRIRLYANDTNLTPNPTCTDNGATGFMSLLDTNEGASDVFSICDGTTFVDNLNVTTTRALVFPLSGASTNAGTPTDDDDCRCWLFFNSSPMAFVDKAVVEVVTLDADDTVEVAIYSLDGQREYLEVAVDVTGIGYKSTNVNQLTTCTAQTVATPCPAGNQPLPRGDYFFCVGSNTVGTLDYRFRGAFEGGLQYQGSFNIANACVAGEMPATITPALAYTTASAGIPPTLVLTDE